MSEIVLSSDSEDQKPKLEPEPLDCDEVPSPPPPVYNLQSVFDSLDYLISQDGYLCVACPVHRRRPFRDMKDLRRHMIGHVNGGRSSSTSEIRCTHCGLCFGSVLQLRKHLLAELDREYGGPSNPGDDPACLGNEFEDSGDEEEVINYVVKGGTLTCSVCDAEFGLVTRWNKEKFKMHVGKDHWKPALFKCDECGKRFCEEARLEKHLKKHALVMSVGWMGTEPTTTTCEVQIDAEDAMKDPVDIQDELLPQPEVLIKTEPEENEQPGAIIIQPAESSESSESESSSEDDKTDKPVFTSKKKQAKADRIARKEALLKTAVRKISDGTDGSPIILACNICDEGFLKQDLLDRHMATKHDDRDRPFRCEKCPKTYMSNANLQEHVRMVHEGVKFTCDQCNIQLGSKSSWKRHMRGHSEKGHCCDICQEKCSSHSTLMTHKRRVHENSTKNFICVDCGNTYDNGSALRDHRVTHTSERKWECTTCGMKFKRNHNLISHQRVHAAGRPVVTFKCQECDEEFTTKGALAAHKSSHGRITCRLCEQTFNDQAELMRHRREDHKITKRDPGVTCRTCHQRFADQGEMLEHRAEAHPMTNPMECEVCKSVFGSASALRAHMRGHAPKTRSHDCPNCDESFICALMLQTHIKETHPDMKNHVCDLCGRGYPTRKQLLAHMGRHRNPNRERASNTPGHYMCHICGKEFNLRASFKRHVFNNHTNARDFKCAVCDKQLVSAEGLKLHLKSHDEQHFMCSTCGKGFSQPYRLRAHMLLHERELAEERCPICNRAFRDKKKLDLHIKSHTGETEFSCTPCQRFFASDKLLQKHILRMHQSSTPCPVCAKVFPTEAKMKNHSRIHDNPTFFECPTCYTCIKEKKHFEAHMKGHLQGGVRFTCRFCPLTFSLAKTCRNHERRFHAEQVGEALGAGEGASGEKPAKKKKRTMKEEDDGFAADGMMDDPLGMMDFTMGQREDDVSVG
uniref:Zinc finger protein 337 n=1 Tax=Culex pipiens TaxID=7175 RepID=A0A8D8B706_CULPI